MDEAKTMRPLVWLAILIAAGLAVYSSGLKIPYYADDYQFVFDLSPGWSIHSFFARDVPENGFYRPIQAAFLWTVQRLWGTDTLPVHLAQLALHVLLSWLVFVFMLDLGFARLQAALGSLFMLLSQANVHAVSSNDTLSQIASPLFGYLSVWLVYRSRAGRPEAGPPWPPARRRYCLGTAALALSLLSKESGIVFLPMIAVVIAVMVSGDGRSARLRRFLIGVAPFAVLTAIYLLVRSWVAGTQPGFGPAKYQFGLGANLIRNTGLLMLATAMPVSSVKAYIAARSGSYWALSGAMAATAAVLLAAGCGLRLSRRRHRTLLLLGAFLALGVLPMVMLNHVSELYTYNTMPVASAFLGIGLGGCLGAARKSRTVSLVLTAAVIMMFVSNVIAVESKVGLMKQSGARSDALLAQIEPFLADVPAGGRLVLLNPCGGGEEYSIFLVNGFNVLQNALHRLNQLAGREDFTTEVVDRCRASKEDLEGPCLALTLGDRVMLAGEE